MSDSEELREALLNLEAARKREAQQRQMAEALLAGLHTLVMTADPDQLFLNLFDVMRTPLDFKAAFVLLEESQGRFAAVASSDPVFAKTRWHGRGMFKRVLAGRPAAVFDTGQVEEWLAQPEAVRKAACSALHFLIHTTEQNAIFVCTHSEPAHFSKDHIHLAGRFSGLASQALQKLESEARIANLEEKLAAEAKIAQLNRKLAESEKKLARAQKMEAIGLLAGGVAHDLNNILSGIVSYPELLLMQKDLSEQNRHAIRTIKAAGLRAAAVVDDLLTVARGVASPREQVALNQVVEQFLRSPEYQQIMEAHPRVSLQTDLDPELFPIKASSIHLKKALMNLILNGAEGIGDRPDGRIRVLTRNRYIDRPLKGYEEVRQGEYAVLTVSDNGPGISAQDMDRIFEPFYTKKIMGRSGTGLGLTVVWNTMQEHDGYIDLATDTQGSAFSLYFPITREPIPDPGRISVADYGGDGQTVLVVDDQKEQQDIISAILTHLGYRVNAVSSGEEAVEYVKNHPVDLLVLDMIMDPGINGRETYERILELRPDQKAVIASGYAMTEEVKAAQQRGAGRYIKKPFTVESLGMAVKAELGRGPSENS